MRDGGIQGRDDGRTERTNYVLIGMPASGKSSMGRQLAQILDRPFLDTDLVMKEKTGKTPGELMAATDFPHFVRTEEAVILDIQAADSIIATGGSVVYSPLSMAHLKSMATIIYLEDSFRHIQRRVGALDSRGVIARPGQSFKEVYRERSRLYRHYADLTWSNYERPPWKSVYYLAALIRFMEAAQEGETQ